MDHSSSPHASQMAKILFSKHQVSRSADQCVPLWWEVRRGRRADLSSGVTCCGWSEAMRSYRKDEKDDGNHGVGDGLLSSCDNPKPANIRQTKKNLTRALLC
jgi:hypothetical protein